MPEKYYYKCDVCSDMFPVEELKYHTPEHKPPVKIFCGAECSFKYHNEKRLENESS